MRSETPRIDSGINSSTGSSSASRARRVSPSPDGPSPQDRTITLYEGESRRLRRTPRAIMQLNYYLHSLRLPRKRGDKKSSSSSSNPNLLSLRNSGKLYTNGNLTRVVAYLNTVMEDPEVTSETYHRASIVLDTCLPRAENMEPLEPIHQDALVDYQSIVHAVMFRTDTFTSNARYHVVCKLFPRAGMPRRFAPILCDYMNADPGMKREITEIILCSLLGNYTHCTKDSRADAPMRQTLYGIFMPLTFYHAAVGMNLTDHIVKLVHGGVAPLLSLFAMREYLVFLIDDDPVLRSHAVVLFEYEAFRVIVLKAMADVRVYIRENMRDGGTMTEATIEMNVHIDALNALLKTGYEAVVKRTICRKPKPMPFDLIKSARGRLPPALEWGKARALKLHYCCEPTSDEKCSVTRGHTRAKRNRNEEEDDDEQQEEEEEEEEEKGESKRTGGRKRRKRGGDEPQTLIREALGIGAAALDVADVINDINDSKEVAAVVMDQSIDGCWRPSPHDIPPEEGSRAITRDCIFAVDSAAICEMIKKIDPATSGVDAFRQVLEYLPALGASLDGITRHLKLGLTQHEGQNTLRLWEETMTELRRDHPYTYNLVQAAAAAWIAHSSIRCTELPYHYLKSQTMAIAARYELLPPPAGDGEEESKLPLAIPDQPCRIVLCRVCKRVYSIVRKRPQPPKKKLGRPKPIPTHGYVDVTVDLTTDEMFCNKGRSWMHEKCGESPLSEVTIIANEFRFAGHTHFICAQPTCGQIAILNAVHTVYTEHGAACYMCSNAIRTKRAEVSPAVQQVRDMLLSRRLVRKTNKLATQKERVPDAPHCYLCDRIINSEAKLLLYGVSTYLCHRHQQNEIRAYIHAGMARCGYSVEVCCDNQTEDTTRELLLKYATAHKELFKRANDRIRKAMRAREQQAAATKKIMKR